MRRIVVVFCFALLALSGWGCVSTKHTIRRVGAVTPAPQLAVIPPEDPVGIVMTDQRPANLDEIGARGASERTPAEGSGKLTQGGQRSVTTAVIDPLTGQVVPRNLYDPQYYKSADLRTLGRIYNNTTVAIMVHMPDESEVLKFRLAGLTYSQVRNPKIWDDPNNWVHVDILPFKAGSSENYWIRIPAGSWPIVYDHGNRGWGGNPQRGQDYIWSDYTVADGFCRGTILDWAFELGTLYCNPQRSPY